MKLRGSAILWAVFALLIVMITVTGIIALNKSYSRKEIQEAAKTRAFYLARSGADISVSEICDGNASFVPSYPNSLSAVYELDGTECVVTVKRDEAAYKLTVVAECIVADVSSTVTASLSLEAGVWVFNGYSV